jgi:heat shock protein HslJ
MRRRNLVQDPLADLAFVLIRFLGTILMRPILVMAAIVKASLIAPCATPLAAGSAPPAITTPWTARGNEPNWMLTLDAGTMVFRTMDGGAISAALPKPVLVGGAWAYRASAENLTVSLRSKICRDTMTGMPSPMTVRIHTGGKTFAGCGGNPSELLAGEWRVVSINGKSVPQGVKVSLAFDVATGQVSGSSGCNRFFGGFALTGEGLSFKPGMAGSMMACNDPATRTEEAFKAALPKVQRFDIGADGSLRLLAGEIVTIKARRDPKG